MGWRQAGPSYEVDPASQHADLAKVAKRARTIRSYFWSSPAFVASSVLALFVATRLLSVSNADPAIAVAIASSGNLAALALAAFISALPSLLTITAIYCTNGAFDAPLARTRRTYALIVGGCALACAYIAPLYSLAGIAIIITFFFIANRFFKAGPKPNEPVHSYYKSLVRKHVSDTEWLELEHLPDAKIQQIRAELKAIPAERFPSKYFAAKRAELHHEYGRRYREVMRPRLVDSSWGQALVSGATFVVLTFFFSQTFWLPREHYEFAQQPSVVGYTLR